ncbi:MAG: UxaA family hydrolase [Actinobacteria bacterium]|nr:UxaA family hydrolase [Actinomycetota bacterium]
MDHQFLIHHEGDDVAVAIEDVPSGREAVAVAMDTGGRVTVTTRGEVPLGHKVALKDLKDGDDVHKYGVAVGHVTADVSTGDYIHTHNMRSSRW